MLLGQSRQFSSDPGSRQMLREHRPKSTRLCRRHEPFVVLVDNFRTVPCPHGRLPFVLKSGQVVGNSRVPKSILHPFLEILVGARCPQRHVAVFQALLRRQVYHFELESAALMPANVRI